MQSVVRYSTCCCHLISSHFVMSGLRLSSNSTSSEDTLRSEGCSSDEEEEHNVENAMWCSFAQDACSPILQGFVHEEELCQVASTCHFGRDLLVCRIDKRAFYVPNPAASLFFVR